MDARYLLPFAHISLIFTGVTIAWGPRLLTQLAYQSGQVVPLRAVATLEVRAEKFIPVFYMAGGLFGLLTALAFGYNLLAPWLVIAYVLFATATFTGIRWAAPTSERIVALAEAAPPGPIPAPIRELFESRRAVAVTVFDLGLVIVLVFDMVVKPFS